ncbi:hypothetical protein HZB60_00755 [candidate division KSB1 bacterium]|nr:hypothetical protein [candidate division KSB1 bacterium]
MNWFLTGIIASLLYGVCAASFKFVLSEKYLHASPSWALIGMGLGWSICGIIGARMWQSSAGESTLAGLGWGIPVGLLNGVATLMIMRAISVPTTNVSQLVPIYNTNTLVAFVLGILLFRELPIGPDLYRNLAGAVLIVLGSVLIGMK